MRFSQRIGKSPIKTVLQVESMDKDLKNRLWNAILGDLFDAIYKKDYSRQKLNASLEAIWKEFFKSPIDWIPSKRSAVSFDGFKHFLREWYFKAEWFEIYDFIEFLLIIDKLSFTDFRETCSEILKEEVAGYRIIDLKIVQITTEEEGVEIEEALANSDQWYSVNIHLKSALESLSDRKTPNYRNSIKESISAVEAYSKILTGNDKAKFSDILTEIEKKNLIHSALKRAFTAMYGYTSDSGGIRHAFTETDRNVEFEDAKFMLVTCSAFINYLKAKVTSSGNTIM